ncbi:MAG: perosamine synthetase [Thermoanaerobaculia bacterium]|jgi:perosamine synthetase|nr:perosamine synthetase [Thermoanaerobaculia bacterium]
MAPRSIPLSSPDITSEERRLVDEVLSSGQLSFGPVLEAFEIEFAAKFGARHAVAMSSGTAALHLAMIAAGVSDGDLVITTPFSFVASANSILFERGIPHFVDIDPVTLSMDPAAAVHAIETLAPQVRLRAVLPVHIFGRTVEMDEILIAARRHGVTVIEDACEAIGASADGVFAGRWGDASAFGFYPNKQITTGEGGMLLTDRDDWARLARSLRNQGRSDSGSWLAHDRLGFNYRMDTISAAIGLAQIRRFDELLEKREAVALRYNESLAGIDGISPLAPARAGARVSWFVYMVRLENGLDREHLQAALAARGVDSRPYFPPIHLLPFYRQRFGFRPGMFPHTEAAGASLLALPFHGNLPADDVDYVCEMLASEVRKMKVQA